MLAQGEYSLAKKKSIFKIITSELLLMVGGYVKNWGHGYVKKRMFSVIY